MIIFAGGMFREVVAAKSLDLTMEEGVMHRLIEALRTVLAGFGGAFAWYPTGRLEQYNKPQSVEERMHRNFARVGARMEAAMTRIRDEQRKETAAR